MGVFPPELAHLRLLDGLGWILKGRKAQIKQLSEALCKEPLHCVFSGLYLSRYDNFIHGIVPQIHFMGITIYWRSFWVSEAAIQRIIAFVVNTYLCQHHCKVLSIFFSPLKQLNFIIYSVSLFYPDTVLKSQLFHSELFFKLSFLP